MKPARVGAYELGAVLGRGGAGVVHRARGPAGDEVAVKILKKSDPDSLAKFERERRLLASIGEGFVPLLDSGSSSTGAFLVMPFVRGGTLRDRLRRGPLSVADTVAIGRALASAIGRAHAQGIVHRDLKPENILFGDDGAPLIADLGLAKHFDHEAPGASQTVALTGDGAAKGTFGYMAPEQMNDAKLAGPPADVFALGAVLYECLAGEAAFSADTYMGVVRSVLEGRFPPLAKRRPDAPARLVAVIERALAPDLAVRWADGRALARALEGARRGRSRNPVLAVSLGVAVVGVGTGAVLLATRRAPPDSAVATVASASPTASPNTEGPPVDVAALLAQARAGKLAESLSDEERAGREIARSKDPATAATVARELDGVTALLRAATRSLYLEAKVPTDAEKAELLAEPLEGLEGVLDRSESLLPGEELDDADSRLLARAARRLETRLGAADYSTSVRALLAARQTKRIPAAQFSLARVAVTALSRLEGAVALDAVMRHVAAEQDEARATRLVAFFTTSGRAEARRLVLGARKRFGQQSAFWKELGPALRDKEPPGEPTAASVLVRAEAALERGDFDEARRLADRAVALDAKSARAWLIRGVGRHEQGEFAAAESDLTQAIALDPTQPRAYDARALSRRELGRPKPALEDAMRAIDLDGDRADAWFVAATIQRELDAPEIAAGLASRSIELDPHHAKSYQARAYAELALGKREAAIADLEEFLRLAPQVGSAAKVRAKLAELRKAR